MAGSGVDERLGAEVEWRLFGTGPAVVNSFEEGELDLAYIGLPPAVIGISRGVGIICVAGGHMEGTVISGKRELLAFPEDHNLGSILRQLTGKKIGVPGKGSIHDVIVSDCLARFGLVKRIEIVHFPWADQVLEAMVKGEVWAAVGTPALAVAVRTYADAKILYPPSRLWPHNPSYGILVDKTFLHRHKELVEKFLILHEEATALIRKNPRKAAQRISDLVGFIDPDFVLETLRVSPKYCSRLTQEYISATMEFAATLRRLGYTSRDVSASEIFDTSLITKIHPEKDHYGEGIADDGP
jgi:NitT/TauT family transport system substrate-binding protein